MFISIKFNFRYFVLKNYYKIIIVTYIYIYHNYIVLKKLMIIITKNYIYFIIF